MIEVTGKGSCKYVNEDHIKILTERKGRAVIGFTDGSEVIVEESIKTLRMRIKKNG